MTTRWSWNSGLGVVVLVTSSSALTLAGCDQPECRYFNECGPGMYCAEGACLELGEERDREAVNPITTDENGQLQPAVGGFEFDGSIEAVLQSLGGSYGPVPAGVGDVVVQATMLDDEWLWIQVEERGEGTGMFFLDLYGVSVDDDGELVLGDDAGFASTSVACGDVDGDSVFEYDYFEEVTDLSIEESNEGVVIGVATEGYPTGIEVGEGIRLEVLLRGSGGRTSE